MIKRQCQRLIMNGYGEIVLCGVDIGSYGSDFEDVEIGLTALLRSLLEMDREIERQIDGKYRLRLSSTDPVHISDEFIDLLGRHPRICPQLHLSLQSANTLILKRMKRRATTALIYERIGALRATLPDLVLSADILVGFPTENEAHFTDTLRAVHELEIAYPHVFRYSPRPGTPASRIPSQVPMPIRKRRAKAVRDAGEVVWKRVAKRQIGEHQTVLVESANYKTDDLLADSTNAIGRAANYFAVEFRDCVPQSEGGDENNREKQGCQWGDVEITGVGDKVLLGRRLD